MAANPSTDAQAIRIADLARPIPTPTLAARIAEADAAAPPVLSEEGVLRAACERTGLSDFGSDDFRGRLRLWIACVDQDAGLTAFGRAGLFGHFVQLAANRLRVEALLRRHPEILEVQLPAPIIIAGLPRSGTTHLHNFIASDPRLRSLPHWEALEPVPDGVFSEAGESEDGRQARARAGWDQFVEMCPLMPLMHEMEPDHVTEEIELQQLDFSSYSLDWRLRAPAWRDFYLEQDQTPHYYYLRKVLQVLTWLRGPQRWVLKCPQHMEQFGPLLRAFPDGTFLVTHRDPVAVLRSATTMAAYTDRLRRREVDLPALAGFWIDRIERLLRACVRDRELLPRDRSLDISFEAFMVDEPGTLRSVNELAGLPVTAAIERRLGDYLAANRRGRHGRIVYDLEGDFGVDSAALRERFQFYYERFGIQPEADGRRAAPVRTQSA
ncbi:sulfotransferase family protein [Sphingosinicella terrae]|uniref:sulfotransferase family protein n=1 Tax=Sphingosinicella terrae TaxID=2172047 RepID=UPI000E0CE66B|nr:sulfotransferase [Sphingosinicella terrae]